MKTDEYKALREFPAERFAEHMERESRRATLVLEEEPAGYRATYRLGTGEGRTVLLRTSNATLAMSACERAAGQELRFEVTDSGSFLVRDWRPGRGE